MALVSPIVEICLILVNSDEIFCTHLIPLILEFLTQMHRCTHAHMHPCTLFLLMKIVASINLDWFGHYLLHFEILNFVRYNTEKFLIMSKLPYLFGLLD